MGGWTGHAGSALSAGRIRLGSVVCGFGYEDDLDVAAVDVGFLLGADGEGGDGVAGGLGQQRGPMGGAVDVVLLDGYGGLGEDEVGLVELVDVDVALRLGVVQMPLRFRSGVRPFQTLYPSASRCVLPLGIFLHHLCLPQDGEGRRTVLRHSIPPWAVISWRQ